MTIQKKTLQDAPTKAVFTTKVVIEENKVIIYVTHEIEDGTGGTTRKNLREIWGFFVL